MPASTTQEGRQAVQSFEWSVWDSLALGVIIVTHVTVLVFLSTSGSCL